MLEYPDLPIPCIDANINILLSDLVGVIVTDNPVTSVYVELEVLKSPSVFVADFT